MARGSLRGNAFLIAAVGLPVVVVLLFLVATAVPAWLVAPPAHDLVLRVGGAHDPSAPPFAVTFAVRDGRVEATFRPLAANEYPQPDALFLFDHETLTVRRVPVEIPDGLDASDQPLTIPVEALAGRTVLADEAAPDGYVFDQRTRRGPGIVGEIFGMRRYDQAGAVVKRGRVVPVELPSTYRYQSKYPLGWIVSGEAR